MAEDDLHQLIKQAKALTPDEQLRLFTHLEEMIQQLTPSAFPHPKWVQIQAHRSEILGIAAKYGAFNVRIFGLGVQGETQAKGEVDFIVNLEAGRSLLDLGGLLMDLRDLLGYEVYVVSESGLKDERRERVLKQAIPL